MKVNVISLDNKKVSDIELNADVFGLELRQDILHRMVEWQRAKRQSGTHKTKERGEVHGTTKKPFAQKGTGNARQGSLKGPHQRGGGNAHGPRARSHAYGLTKKFRQLGLRTALSLKAAQGKLQILENFNLETAKTKELSAQLDTLGLSNVLIIDTNVTDNIRNAANNIKHLDVLPQIGANVYSILKRDTLILTVDAVKQLEERLA